MNRPKHKRKILRLFIPLVMITLGGCSELYKTSESDFIIKVSGSKDLKFNGHYSFVDFGSTSVPQNVEGAVPSEYKGKGVISFCLFRKTALEGNLKVEILKGEEVIAKGETAVPYGVVSLKSPAPKTENIVFQILKKIVGG